MEFLIASISYGIAYMAAGQGAYLLSGLLLLAGGAALYFYYAVKNSMMLHPLALLMLSWVGGCGVSALKLSRLQTDWENETWLCFFLCAVGAAAGYRLAGRIFIRFFEKPAAQALCGSAFLAEDAPKRLKRLLKAVCVLTLCSAAAFCFEAWYLSYIPLFTVDTPHAYSYFHVSGVHYVTVSCVLVPALSWQYLRMSGKLLQPLPLFCMFLSFLIPVLCVSRFQLIFAVAMLVFTAILSENPDPHVFLKGRMLFLMFAGCVLLLLAYLFLTVQRAHSVSYLNEIFEMKRADTPIWFTQPYMYIANNFDNFNCLIKELPQHTHGLRMLFPVFALTGLKFLIPKLVSFPLYVTKEELTTLTLVYDAYYDFGIIGVFVFMLLTGFLLSLLAFFLKKAYSLHMRPDPVCCLIAAQLCFYSLFAFFTTWFSNPTTWFYLAVSLLIGLYTAGINLKGHLIVHRNKVQD